MSVRHCIRPASFAYTVDGWFVDQRWVESAHLVGLAQTLSPRTETRRGRGVEVASEHWGKERAEDNLGTAEGGQREPKEEDELEREVERKPINNVHEVLEDSKKSKDDPVSEPLGIVRLAGREESIQRVVARNDEASQIRQKLAAEVKDDQQEVECDEAGNGVGLGHAGRALEVVEERIFRQLSVELVDIALHAILRSRHVCECFGKASKVR